MLHCYNTHKHKADPDNRHYKNNNRRNVAF